LFLEPPVFGEEDFDAGGVFGVGGGVFDFGEIEGFAALDAGAAAAAVEIAAFVAGPGLSEGHAELGTAAHDVGLCPIDERADQRDLFPVGQFDGHSHGVGKLVAAVGIDGVVARVGGVGDLLSFNREGVPGRNREKDHVPIGHDGALHRFLGVVPLGDFDFRRGQAAASEEWLDGRQVGSGLRDAKLRANRGGVVELAAVALSIVDGKGVQFVACVAQVIEEDSGIEPSGIDDDSFHEFSDCA